MSPAPYVWGPPPAPDPPATALKTFGILAIVFASVNALGNVVGILQAAVGARQFAEFGAAGPPGSPDMDAQMAAMRDYAGIAFKVSAAEGGLMILMDVGLFVIGLLLLQRREGGRKAAIAWSIAGLFVLALRGALFEVLVWPRFERVLDGSGAGGGGSGAGGGFMGMMSGFAHAGTYVTLLFMAIFPVAMLVAMNLTSVKATVKDPPGAERVG